MGWRVVDCASECAILRRFSSGSLPALGLVDHIFWFFSPAGAAVSTRDRFSMFCLSELVYHRASQASGRDAWLCPRVGTCARGSGRRVSGEVPDAACSLSTAGLYRWHAEAVSDLAPSATRGLPALTPSGAEDPPGTGPGSVTAYRSSTGGRAGGLVFRLRCRVA